MKQPFIIVGVGTDVSTRVVLPVCERIRAGNRGIWPDHLCALMADGDEQTRTRHAHARLPADRVAFVPLSLVQVREALAWRREEFGDAWRDGWQDLLVHGPDNGACMVPAIGRMMIKAARPAILQHLQAFARRLSVHGAKAPEVFILWSPVSGTSRGSVLDLPRYVRAAFPDSAIHAVVIHPVRVEELDPAVGRIFQANFVEALRLIDHYAQPRSHQVWVDDQKGWQQQEARLVDNVFAFDHRFGNQRFRHLDEPRRSLDGDLAAVFERVADFLVGTVTGDPLYERLRARFADAEMHRSERHLAGRRTYLFGVHEARARLDLDAFRRALVQRAVQRVATALAGARATEKERSASSDADFFGGGTELAERDAAQQEAVDG